MSLMIKSNTIPVTVKNVTEDGYQVEGPLVTFDSIDLDDERFYSLTDFNLDADGTKETDIYYHHGLDPTINKRVLGKGNLSLRDSNIWLEAQIKIRDEYDRHILTLAKNGKLGWSSGTAPHLAERKIINNIKTWVRWPLGLDASLTPTPAEPKNSVNVKSSDLENVTTAKEIKIMTNENKEEKTSEEFVTKSTLQEFGVKFGNEIKSIGEAIKALTDRIEELPTKSKLGYYSETGGDSDKTTKSFGDYLLAVKRRDTKRLSTVYKSQYETVKDVTVNTGITGGYAVPEEYRSDILQMAVSSSELLSMATIVPVGSMSGNWPALDQTIATTAGSGESSMSAGVGATMREPGEAFTEETPNFTNLQWTVRSVGGYTQVQNEMSADSPLAIESLLRSLFVVAISNKNERNMIRGSGVGEFLGVLNAPCAVGVTPATNNVFAWVDSLSMQSRLKVINPSKVAWSIHPSIIPDIGQFETTGGGGVLQANLQSPLGVNLLGKKIVQSEHQPQANNSGCVILGDWSTYLLFKRNDLIIDFSEHVGFLNGLDTWRFYERSDGKPWLKNSITLADPQGSFTQSTFVYFND